MTRDKMLTVLVEEDFKEKVKAKSLETGVPYAVVLRRALEAWVNADVLPPITTPHSESKPTKAKGVKRSKPKK